MSPGPLTGLRIGVAVVGDLGRSPRVQNEALAAAQLGARVELIGFEGSEVFDDVARHPGIRLHRARAPRPLATPWGQLDAARLLGRLLDLADRGPDGARPSAPLDLLICQSPPALPTLPVALARRRGRPWVVDWHNDGAAMLACGGGAAAHWSPLVGRLERWLGRRASGHLCVTRAMAERRRGDGCSGPLAVLYDRPAERFVRARAEREAFRRELARRLGFPDLLDGDRLLVVTATSYTADEDLVLLADALCAGDRRSGRPLLVVSSGRGKGREAFERRARPLLDAGPDRAVALRTLWLEPAEYPALLAAADLAVSMHRSASGLDLPMKLADYRGVGVPALALAAGGRLEETFRLGVDGWSFSTGAELRGHLERLGRGDELWSARARLVGESPVSFEEGFGDEGLPVLLGSLGRSASSRARSAA